MIGFPGPDALKTLAHPRWTRRRVGPVYARRGMVATAHPLATAAGVRALSNGGNAVDAAIAAALATSVVLPASCGIGGDLFAIVAKQDGGQTRPLSFIGSGISARNSSLDDMRVRGWDGGRLMPQQGPLSPSVPGLVNATYRLLEHYGTKSFAELAADAISLAGDGFPISAPLVAAIANNVDLLKQYPATAAVFLPGGRPPRPGTLFRQTDLAKTMQEIADGGNDAFYRGGLAKRIGSYLAENGGVLTADDFCDQETIVEPPICSTYRKHSIYETGLPTQGFLLLEALNIVENDDICAIDVDSAAGVHQLVEAMKLSFADRLSYAGDPQFVTTPLDMLISKAWANKRHAEIQMGKAADDIEAGPLKSGDTTYLCVVDGDGLMVSLILSVSGVWGSGVIAGDTGVLLNNRAGNCFSLEDGHPNIYAPGKKTIHTLNCYLIADPDGTPMLVGGTPGGDSQPQWNLQVVSALIDGQLDVQAAAEMPRWSSWPGTYPIDLGHPFELRIEDRFGLRVLSELEEWGHRLVVGGPWSQGGAVGLITRDPESGALAGAEDPRSEGLAVGF